MKNYTLLITHSSRFTNKSSESTVEGTLEYLVKYFSYTLEVGASWEHEKGNSKINRSPKTIKSLISNVMKAKDNAAANGYSGYNVELIS